MHIDECLEIVGASLCILKCLLPEKIHCYILVAYERIYVTSLQAVFELKLLTLWGIQNSANNWYG